MRGPRASGGGGGNGGDFGAGEEGLGHEGAAVVDFSELGADGGHDGFDDVIFVEEVDFAFGGVHVDIDALRFDVESEVDEGMTAFGEEGGVCSCNGLLDCRRLDSSMVDEQ